MKLPLLKERPRIVAQIVADNAVVVVVVVEVVAELALAALLVEALELVLVVQQ